MKYQGYAQKRVHMKFDMCAFFFEFSDARTRMLLSHSDRPYNESSPGKGSIDLLGELKASLEPIEYKRYPCRPSTADPYKAQNPIPILSSLSRRSTSQGIKRS